MQPLDARRGSRPSTNHPILLCCGLTGSSLPVKNYCTWDDFVICPSAIKGYKYNLSRVIEVDKNGGGD